MRLRLFFDLLVAVVLVFCVVFASLRSCSVFVGVCVCVLVFVSRFLF